MVPKNVSINECSFDGCGYPVKAQSYCGSHYRQLRLGRGMFPVKRLASKGLDRFWDKVDKTPTCWNWQASTFGGGYGKFRVGETHAPAHRVSYEMENGPIPDGMEIDHACRNKLCVNPAHLRTATRSQNMENMGGAFANNRSSGARNVTWNKSCKKWQVIIGHHGKKRYLGVYEELD